jgi:hypothetical protein
MVDLPPYATSIFYIVYVVLFYVLIKSEVHNNA